MAILIILLIIFIIIALVPITQHILLSKSLPKTTTTYIFDEQLLTFHENTSSKEYITTTKQMFTQSDLAKRKQIEYSINLP